MPRVRPFIRRGSNAVPVLHCMLSVAGVPGFEANLGSLLMFTSHGILRVTEDGSTQTLVAKNLNDPIQCQVSQSHVKYSTLARV